VCKHDIFLGLTDSVCIFLAVVSCMNVLGTNLLAGYLFQNHLPQSHPPQKSPGPLSKYLV